MTPLAMLVASPAGGGMGPMAPVHVDGHVLLADWQRGPFPIGVAVVLVAVAVWYLLAGRALGRRGRRWSAWRTVSFLAGLVTVEVALGSSASTLAGSTFTAHVIQHLLLMVLGPPLAALGAPMTLLLQTSSRPTKRRILKVLHSGPFAVVSHPVTVFFLYYLSMYAFFLTGALQTAMDHMWLMDLINLGFLGGATLFWWPMVGIDPIPRGRMSPALKLINLMIGIPIESFLGIALLMTTTPVASMYTLATSHAGGGVLWAAGELATAVAMIPIFVEWTRVDARAGRRVDARIDAGETGVPAVVAGGGMSATLRSLRRG